MKLFSTHALETVDLRKQSAEKGGGVGVSSYFLFISLQIHCQDDDDCQVHSANVLLKKSKYMDHSHMRTEL